MKINGVHFLLTYSCNFECDHCFLYCSPGSRGTFTIAQIREALKEIKKIETIDSVSFEGGEPFLVYPVLKEAIRLSNRQGLKTSVETNNYWATTVEDAILWLEPLQKAGLDLLDISADIFHHGEEVANSAKCALEAAETIGLKTSSICIEKPDTEVKNEKESGKIIYHGNAKLRGRAVDKLVDGLATKPCEEFTECPLENLRDPGRIHLDSFGNIHLCQGLSMGNIWEAPFSELLKNYDPDSHPICGPLLKGGPFELAKKYNINIEDQSVNSCHFCSKTCKALIEKFPQYITPPQVYGL